MRLYQGLLSRPPPDTPASIRPITDSGQSPLFCPEFYIPSQIGAQNTILKSKFVISSGYGVRDFIPSSSSLPAASATALNALQPSSSIQLKKPPSLQSKHPSNMPHPIKIIIGFPSGKSQSPRSPNQLQIWILVSAFLPLCASNPPSRSRE